MCPHCKAIISHVKCWKHFQANTITFEAVLLTFFFHSLPLCLHTCKEEELTAMKICSLFLLRVRKNTFCAFCWGQLPTLYQNNIVFKILNTPLNLGSKCRFQTLALMLAPFSFDLITTQQQDREQRRCAQFSKRGSSILRSRLIEVLSCTANGQDTDYRSIQ